ncbi:MAG: hybrid sensor histidine kinase/response regulator, partial [Deltaproteobacteria bacterium]|nr:hybrid sensor histidine kinase/response regulator [Deltaproteobacteria bacterium]
LMMPRIHGEQIVAAIREVPDLATTPIIVLTARSDVALRVRLLHGGAQDYMLKPFAVDELIARIDNLISIKRARDVLRAEVVSSRDDVAELAEDLARRTRQARFVANASIALSRSLDYQTTLSEVAHLAVPDIADACAVDVVTEDGSLRRVAIAATEPEAERLLETPGSVVPLEARDHRVGVLSLAWNAQRHHGCRELALAEELAGSAALAIDNAALYLKARTAVGLRDEFLSIASHELRTPLQPPVIAAQTLAESFAGDGANPEMHRKLVGTVVRQVDRLRVLVDELLDGTRIETGNLSLVRERVDLGALVQSVIERCAPQLERVGCATTLHQTAPVVGDWDRSRLEQVVSNLLANAIKFAAGRPVDITCARVGARARLTFRDHGIGIAPERHAQIFERFGRAVSARHYGGLGLGLYICRRIVEAHRGSITVESRPGTGSVFTVELPL